MVRIGHVPLHPPFVEYRFHNPDSTLGLEVLPAHELRTRLSASARSSLHRGDFHQLFVVTAGEIDAVVDFAERRCGRGEVLHVRPGQMLRLPAERPGSAAVAVLFTPTFPQPQPFVDEVVSPFGVAVYRPAASDPDSLVTAASELARDYALIIEEPSIGPVSRALLRQLLGVLLLRMAMAGERQVGATDTTALATVRRFLHDLDRSFAVDRTASAYAQRAGCSLRTLNRACVSVTGRGVKELIDARVVLEAKRLLAHTGVPVATLARTLGFSEATNFGKFFERRAGVSPGAFRAGSGEPDLGRQT